MARKGTEPIGRDNFRECLRALRIRPYRYDRYVCKTCAGYFWADPDVTQEDYYAHREEVKCQSDEYARQRDALTAKSGILIMDFGKFHDAPGIVPKPSVLCRCLVTRETDGGELVARYFDAFGTAQQSHPFVQEALMY